MSAQLDKHPADTPWEDVMDSTAVRLGATEAHLFNDWLGTTALGAGELDNELDQSLMVFHFAWNAAMQEAVTEVHFIGCPRVFDQLSSYARMCLMSQSDEAQAAHGAALTIRKQLSRIESEYRVLVA